MTTNLVLCVLVAIMAAGQVLFKVVAANYNRYGTLLDVRVWGILAIAGALYVTSTGLWVWTLRSLELSKAYPFFALGFIIVPLLGACLFGETLSLRFLIGSSCIVIGVFVIGSQAAVR